MSLWGMDHWKTLHYVHTIHQSMNSFHVGFDEGMRQNSRHARIMKEQCPNPLRPDKTFNQNKHANASTKLRTGSIVEGHDDWNCVMDFVSEKMFEQPEFEPGMKLTFSARGLKVATQLEEHIHNARPWEDFRPDFSAVLSVPITEKKSVTIPKPLMLLYRRLPWIAGGMGVDQLVRYLLNT